MRHNKARKNQPKCSYRRGLPRPIPLPARRALDRRSSPHVPFHTVNPRDAGCDGLHARRQRSTNDSEHARCRVPARVEIKTSTPRVEICLTVGFHTGSCSRSMIYFTTPSSTRDTSATRDGIGLDYDGLTTICSTPNALLSSQSV